MDNMVDEILDGVQQGGEKGADGEGVKVGGTTGQVLTKATNANYDTEWTTVAGTGDMTKAIYDPTTINGSAFDYTNFINTPTTITVQQGSDITSNNSFRTTPSTIITAGTNLSWSGNTLNASGGGGSGD